MTSEELLPDLDQPKKRIKKTKKSKKETKSKARRTSKKVHRATSKSLKLEDQEDVHAGLAKLSDEAHMEDSSKAIAESGNNAVDVPASLFTAGPDVRGHAFVPSHSVSPTRAGVAIATRKLRGRRVFEDSDEDDFDAITPIVRGQVRPTREHPPRPLLSQKKSAGAMHRPVAGMGPLFAPSTFDETTVQVASEESLAAKRLYRPSAHDKKAGCSSRDQKCFTKSVEHAWSDELSRLARKNPDFFASEEATLRGGTPVTPGKPGYSSLKLNEKNNHDILEMFRLEFGPKIGAGGSRGSFNQLLIVAGQLMRLSVVRGATAVEEVCERGKLFEAVCNHKAVKLLIDNYEKRSVCTTIATKLAQLKKICEHAKLFFAGKDTLMAAEAQRAWLHPKTIHNVNKGLGRARAAERRNVNDRIASGTLFMPDDFSRCKRRVCLQLDIIKRIYYQIECDSGSEAAEKRLFEKGLIKKWCINLLVLLVVVGGGQRPQVYAQVQIPNEEELEDVRDSSSRMGFVELRTVKEKKSRSTQLPFVLVPGFTLKYIDFHVSFIRRGILEALDYDESDCNTFPLLLHTETGQALTTPQILRTFRKFLQIHEPGLEHITVVNLRSSYGTMMMKSFNDKLIFKGMSSDEFLDQLAKQMNTSMEQLRATYISIDRSDYGTSARMLVEALKTSTGDDEANEDRKVEDTEAVSEFFT